MDAHPIEPTLRDVLRETLDAQHGPHPVWAGSPAARRVAEPQRSRWPLRALAAAAAVLAVAVGGYQFLPGDSGSGGSTATPSPSPALLARGSFVERDWGLVEFEATREGSSVTGRMTIAARNGWGPISVDLQCSLETEDGLVMIGGLITAGNQIWEEGTPAWIALKRGSPDEGGVGAGFLDGYARTTDCQAYLDSWLRDASMLSGEGASLTSTVLGDGGTVEFGP